MPEAVRKMMPTIRYLAMRIEAWGALDADDLIQVGALAAIEALPRFDPKKGNLWHFLRQRAHGAMFDELRDLDHVSRFYRKQGHIDGRPLPETLSFERSPISLVPRVIKDKRAVPPGRRIDAHDFWREIRMLLRPQQLRALSLYYAAGMKQADVGRAMGISESRVCQLLSKAITHLRKVFIRRSRRNA